jgi:hypothetical protein
MERKAEDENARARTQVRNQEASSQTTEEPTATTLVSEAQQNTPQSAHTGEKNREKIDQKKSSFEGAVHLPIEKLIGPFLTILVKHSG